MTKIVATISPSTPVSEKIDIVRINGAFGTFDEILEIIQKAREIGGKEIIIDLPMGRTKHRTSTFSDEALLKFCLENRVEHVSISYVKHPNEVRNLRTMIGQVSSDFLPKIISKIEAKEAIDNLDEIIKESDLIMIDRRDLATAVGEEKIPLAQKLIINKCKESVTPVIVASEAILSMINQPQPSIADLMDIANTVLMGADYVMLSEETAIGDHPIEVVEKVKDLITKINNDEKTKRLDQINPHGGILIDRSLSREAREEYLKNIDNYQSIGLNEEQLMDVDKIAIGAFSPLEGFMTQKELESVLDKMILPSGIVWTIPIILDVSEEEAKRIGVGDNIILTDQRNDHPIAMFTIEDKYKINKDEFITKYFNTLDPHHPGVFKARNLRPVFLGGKISLIERPDFNFKEVEFTPRETRDLFLKKGWRTITGFHTRNVVHRSHEYLQRCVMEVTDALFVSPIIKVVNKEWPDKLKLILKTYETIINNYYPDNKVFLSPILTYSRFAGPREAIFTAIIRKNYGCTHFVVGRDHCGVKDYYSKYASHDIFKEFNHLGIKPFLFRGPFYCKKCGAVVSEKTCRHGQSDHIEITGLAIKEILKSGEIPTKEFIRPEVWKILFEATGPEKIFSEK